MTRHTKVEKEPETEVLTRKTRRAVAQKIADVESVEPAEVPLERKPRKKKIPGRKKTDKGDGMRDLSQRYQGLLRDCFGELNTDRQYDGFTVECQAMMGYYPGTMLVIAKLRKGEAMIYCIEQYVTRYPQDIRDLAIDLYGQMMYNGIEIAGILGV